MSLRLTAAAALAAATTLAAAAPAPAARTGSLVYAGARDGTDVLYERTRDDRVHRLLEGGAIADPVYSPRGRRLALTRELDGARSLWVMSAEGADLRQLTDPAIAAEEPTWSPDGAQLAFAGGPRGERRVFLIGADGLDQRPLTGGGRDEHDPAWSSRGQIAFARDNRGGEDVYVIGEDGGRARRLTRRRGDDTDPAWSRNGRRLVFVRGGAGVWTMRADGRRARRVVNVRGSRERDPRFSPDGRWIVFSAGHRGHRRLWAVRPSGRGLHPLSLPSSDGRTGTWQPAGLAPVVMAAGDVACDPASPYFNGGFGVPRHCAQWRTSNLLLRADLDAALVLGDTQYGTRDLSSYAGSFDPTWGRVRSLIRPVPGNHEYGGTPSAEAYFDYFNGPGRADGPAGPRDLGWFSFDVGDWHVVALNSNCGLLPDGCGPGSREERWLRADLAAHPAQCTLAYLHHPLFSTYRPQRAVRALYGALYDGGADVVLAGHHHYYERFVALDPAGRPDRARGLREFIVGTGGMSIKGNGAPDATVAAQHDETFGVLELTLHPARYHWRFRSASADPYADSGSARCH